MKHVRFRDENGFGVKWERDVYKRYELDGNNNPIIPPMPEGMVFQVEDSVRFEDSAIKLKAHLINNTGENQEIVLVDTSGGYNPFELWFSHDANVSKVPEEGPPRPMPFPEPFVVFIDKDTTIEFEAWIHLNEYTYEPGTEVEVQWNFNFWHDPPRGTMKVVLPHFF